MAGLEPIKINQTVSKALEDGLKNKKLDNQDLEKIEAAMASDEVLDADEAKLLKALKEHTAFSYNDGINIRFVESRSMDFDQDKVAALEPGTVSFSGGQLKSGKVILPDAQEFQTWLKNDTARALKTLIKAYEQGQEKESKELIKSLDSGSRLTLARFAASKKEIKNVGLAKAMVLLAVDESNLKTLLKSGTAKDQKVLLKFLEYGNAKLRDELLDVYFSRPGWSSRRNHGKSTNPSSWGASPDHKPYSQVQPSFETQLQLFEAMMKHKNAGVRAAALRHADDLLKSAKLAAGDTKEDPTGMGLDSTTRRNLQPLRGELLETVAKIRSGDDPYRVASRLDNDDYEYAQRADALESFYGHFGDPKTARAFTARIQTAIAGGLSSHPADLVTFMKKHDDEFSHEDLVTSIGQLLDPPGPAAAERFYQVLAKLTATVKDPEQSLEKRKEAAYALGKFYGAASVAAKRLPEPAMNLLFRLLKLGAENLPYAKKVPKSLSGEGIKWLENNFTDEGKLRDQVKVTRKQIQALMDDAQQELMGYDGSGNDLEASFNTGRSFYEKAQFRD